MATTMLTPLSVALVIALGCSSFAVAGQPGENCDSAFVIPALPYSTFGSTATFEDDYDEICPYNTLGSPDVVYSYTPSEDLVMDVTLCTDSAYDTKLYIYKDVCGGYQSDEFYLCNDDQCSTPSYEYPYVSDLRSVLFEAGHTYYIVIDGYAGDGGEYTLDIDNFESCVQCPQWGIPEGEPVCTDDYVDTYNPGCDAPTPVFQQIELGDVICGTSGTFDLDGQPTVDADWYELNLTEPLEVRIRFKAEFKMIVYWHRTPTGGCDELYTMQSTIGDPCEERSQARSFYSGRYFFQVEPFPNHDVQCGRTYTIEFSTVVQPLGACCILDSSECLDGTTPTQCASLGGIYQGDDTYCADLHCCLLECEDGDNLEGEPLCSDDYDDQFNSGCAGDPIIFSSLVLDQMTCGTTGNFLWDGSNFRDTDWYLYEAPQPGRLIVDGTMECSGLLFLVALPSFECADMYLHAIAQLEPCVWGRLDTQIAADYYAVWLATDLFEGVSCGANYRFEPKFIPNQTGDMNCDGVVNNFDIDAFVLALTDPDAYAELHPACTVDNGDIDGNGQVNNFDIDGFVELLTE